jgi:hypothetical protein
MCLALFAAQIYKQLEEKLEEDKLYYKELSQYESLGYFNSYMNKNKKLSFLI